MAKVISVDGDVKDVFPSNGKTFDFSGVGSRQAEVLAAEEGVMKYAIKNHSGQFWTGECWGVEQAREEYVEGDLPLNIDADNESSDSAQLWDVAVPTKDAVYVDCNSGESVASLVEVREAGDPL